MIGPAFGGGVREQAPDPSVGWVRFRPRRWPAPAALWTDLGRGALAAGGDAVAAEAALAGVEVDDVLYLPPVAGGERAGRDRAWRRLSAAATPLRVQLAPGEAPAGAVEEALFDLLQPLLAGELALLEALPRGASALWPLVAGLTDGEEMRDDGLGRLRRAGVARVCGLVPEIVPAHRRRLAERLGEAAFDRLFHAPAPDERSFVAAVTAAGMEPALERPLPAGPPRLRRNRRAAAALAEAADLWLRLGRPAGQGQALVRASLLAERAGPDLAAVVREGNERVVEWLDPVSTRLLRELFTEGGEGLLAQLRTEYRGGSPPQRR